MNDIFIGIRICGSAHTHFLTSTKISAIQYKMIIEDPKKDFKKTHEI